MNLYIADRCDETGGVFLTAVTSQAAYVSVTTVTSWRKCRLLQAKEKERRLKMREEKMEQQRLHQEERVRKALERAQADPKKKTGRKVVGRSEPPRLRRKEDDGEDQRTREEEELAYFFTE